MRLITLFNVLSHKILFTKCPPFTIAFKEGVPALVLSHITRLLTQFGITGNIFLVRMFLNCMQNLICGLQVGLWAIFGTRFIELCFSTAPFAADNWKGWIGNSISRIAINIE